MRFSFPIASYAQGTLEIWLAIVSPLLYMERVAVGHVNAHKLSSLGFPFIFLAPTSFSLFHLQSLPYSKLLPLSSPNFPQKPHSLTSPQAHLHAHHLLVDHYPLKNLHPNHPLELQLDPDKKYPI
jgi:hypothetical protein